MAPTPGSELESPQLIADSANNLKQGYVLIGDEPILRFDSSGSASRVYYLEDGMGSVIGLAPDGSPTTNNTTRLFYNGFGSLRGTNGPAPTVPTGTGGDFRFQGQWWESATDFYHMRARDYDTRTGRFLSRDPAEGDFKSPETLHPYSFANSNPYVYTDPSGEFTVIEINIAQALQFTLQTLKSAGVNEGKSYILGKLTDAFGKAFLDLIGPLIPGFDFAKLSELLSGNPLGTGSAFDKAVRVGFCAALKEAEMGDYFHYNVRVVDSGSREGDPISAGRNCNGANPVVFGQRRGASYSIPDFIIGPAPLTGRPFGGLATMNQTEFVGEIKSQASTLFGDYIKPGKHRRQLNAIVKYARNHTNIRMAMFIVGRNDLKKGSIAKKAEWYITKRLLGARAILNGVIPVVVNID